jgi:hypothetical protein
MLYLGPRYSRRQSQQVYPLWQVLVLTCPVSEKAFPPNSNHKEDFPTLPNMTFFSEDSNTQFELMSLQPKPTLFDQAPQDTIFKIIVFKQNGETCSVTAVPGRVQAEGSGEKEVEQKEPEKKTYWLRYLKRGFLMEIIEPCSKAVKNAVDQNGVENGVSSAI